MKKILVFGDIYTEQQYFVDSIPLENQFCFSENVTTIIGSKVINAARVLQIQGNEISFVGKVGTDGASESAIQSLIKFGFTPLIDKIENTNLGSIVVITSKSGNSSITLYKGANEFFTLDDIQHHAEKFGQYDGIYAATNLPLPVLYELVEISRAKKIPLFLDIPNQHKDVVLEKLKNVSFFMPNRQEAELMLTCKINSIDDAFLAAKKFREKITGTIIITLDKNGCVYLDSKEKTPIHISTTKVHSVDDTGAGDIFRAVFMHQWLETKNVDSSIKIALQKATESTKIKGVDASIRSLVK